MGLVTLLGMEDRRGKEENGKCSSPGCSYKLATTWRSHFLADAATLIQLAFVRHLSID